MLSEKEGAVERRSRAFETYTAESIEDCLHHPYWQISEVPYREARRP